MRLNIAMACFNTLEICKKSIDSVINNTSGEFMLTIIDNKNPDERVWDYLAEIEAPNVRVIHLGKNIGCHNAINMIMERNNADYFAKIDDDTVVEPEWNERLIEFLEDNQDFAYVGARNANFGNLTEQQVMGDSGRMWKVLMGLDGGPQAIGFSCVLFRAKTVSLYGPFTPNREGLYGGEEAPYANIANYRKDRIALLNEGTHIEHQETIDLDYIVWKFLYGYVGCLKADYEDWKKNKRRMLAGYKMYQETGIRKELVDPKVEELEKHVAELDEK